MNLKQINNFLSNFIIIHTEELFTRYLVNRIFGLLKPVIKVSLKTIFGK